MRLAGNRVSVERRTIDEFQRPRPHAQDHIGPTRGIAAASELGQTYVRERAGHIGEHLDDFHEHIQAGAAEGRQGTSSQLPSASAFRTPAIERGRYRMDPIAVRTVICFRSYG